MTDETQNTSAAAPWYSRLLSTLREWLTAGIEVKHRFDFTADFQLQPWHILAGAAAIYLAWRCLI